MQLLIDSIMIHSSSQLNSNHYFKATRAAAQASKPGLFVQYCRAAIAERERGEMELYIVGNQVVTLVGGFVMPPVKLLGDKLEPKYAILDQLYGVAGRLDFAGQGGTTPEADEELWQEFKLLVDQYAQSLEG